MRRIIDEVEQHCTRRGLRLTPTRRRVLELIVEADGPVKAYDLLDQLKADQPNAAPPTVYRALDFLLENNFIHRLESLSAFVSCFHPDEEHDGQFLVCDQCHSVREIHDAGLADQLHQAAEQVSFHANRQVLEIYGVCDDCSTASKP